MSLSTLTEFDGKVVTYVELAEKAVRDGKFDKAIAYAELASVAQREREWAWAELRGKR